MYFDNQHDARMRLDGTIIKYRGKSSIVQMIDEELKLHIMRLEDGRVFVVGQRDKGVELRAPSLGYMNTPRGAAYAMRKPARMWKQGLSPRHIFYKHQRFPMAIETQDMAHCFDGVYPTLEEARKMLDKGNNPFKPRAMESAAFSRHWALHVDGGMLYKGDVVGRFGDKPVLVDKYVWLAEYLEEVLDEAH